MKKEITTKDAIFIFSLILVIIGTSVIGFKMDPIFPVLMALTVLLVWSRLKGFDWKMIHEGIAEGVGTGVIPMIIFLLIGALIAVWIASGVIPTLMYAGFRVISVKIFLPSAFVACAIVGTSIGSAFTTASTVGLALMGMGISMGYSEVMLAGAIVSGSVFGDKMSPLSDSTNLAAAIAGTDLFKHIRNLMWSTVPAFIIAFILYTILGFNQSVSATSVQTTEFLSALTKHFSVSWLAVIPVVLMFACSIKKIPAIASLLLNVVISSLIAFIQNPKLNLVKLSKIIESGYVSQTGNQQIDSLLTRGGIESMMWSVSLILLTLSLGGVLVKLGVIHHMMEPIAKRLTSPGKLVTATIVGGALSNIMIGEQYLSIILPGRAFKASYEKAGLKPEVLSRALEDSGAVLNALVPWGVSGVFLATALQVPTLAYLPFAFFNLACPIISILSGVTGIGMSYTERPIKKSGTSAIHSN